MRDDEIRTIWSEDDLDRALITLREQLPPQDEALRRARTELMHAIVADVQPAPAPLAGAKHGSRWWRWAAGSAAAASIVIAASLAPALPVVGRAPVAVASASEELTSAAARTGSGAAAEPAPYLYIATHAGYLSSATTDTNEPQSVVEETVTELWLPQDRAAEWVQRQRLTGQRTWLVGSEGLARAEGDGGLFADPPDGRLERGPCGDFPGVNEPLGGDPERGTPCNERRGDWYRPTPRFVADLPRDPGELLARLRTSDPIGGDPQVVALASAALLLRSQQAPPDLRAAMYLALRQLPALQVTDRAVDFDGRSGVALGLVDESTDLRDEIIIDRGNGAFLGERTVLVEPGTGYYAGLPAGTAISYTSVRAAPVQQAEDVPPR